MTITLAPRVFSAAGMEAAECRAVVAQAEQLHWQAGTVLTAKGSRLMPQYRRQDAVYVKSLSGPLAEFAATFVQRCRRLWAGLGQEPVGEPAVFQYQRTLPGGHFTWHRDGATFRPIAAVWMLYLSDHETHGLSGGQTELEVPGRTVRVTPEAGRVVMFGGEVRHRGCVVEAGTKFCLTASMGPG